MPLPIADHYLTTPSYGDTAMIAGVGHGVALGSYLDSKTPNIPLPWLEGEESHLRTTPPHPTPTLPTLPPFPVNIYKWLFLAAARTALGLVTLIMTRCGSRVVPSFCRHHLRFPRVIMKRIVTDILVRLSPPSKEPPGKRYRIVVPVKFISYSVSICGVMVSEADPSLLS